jgi:hypothetical protein
MAMADDLPGWCKWFDEMYPGPIKLDAVVEALGSYHGSIYYASSAVTSCEPRTPETLDQKLARHFPPLGEDGMLPEGW